MLVRQVKKVLNSSVVLAVDDSGRESILLGKGIGWGAKRGDTITADEAVQEIITYGRHVEQDMTEIVLNAGVELTDEERYGGWSDDSDF